MSNEERQAPGTLHKDSCMYIYQFLLFFFGWGVADLPDI
uniref:Uncharacterized protein n=1 Tax=Arundo donax TaxID=35708 RepID=A0A0A8XWD5_ARUDO